jgi:hypothetical protein
MMIGGSFGQPRACRDGLVGSRPEILNETLAGVKGRPAIVYVAVGAVSAPEPRAAS